MEVILWVSLMKDLPSRLTPLSPTYSLNNHRSFIISNIHKTIANLGNRQRLGGRHTAQPKETVEKSRNLVKIK
jgi:hypothetical protein